MDDGSGARRNPARYLAPLALAAVLAAMYLVVQHSTNSGATSSTASAAKGAAKRLREQARRAGGRARHQQPAPQFYTVAPGDTLSEIAAKAGLPLLTLEALNPRLQANAYAIQVGQRVRLRR
ncbi:MAG: LysM peptidoglycan-binding domain-containing protein [Solirubrobacteraceae bacterium]|jgi:LysM repeat protein